MSGNRSKSAFFEGWWVTLSADFTGKAASPTNHCWCQNSRVTALACDIKIFVVRHLVLSQSTRVTDGETDGQTDRQNYNSQDRPRICSRGKNASLKRCVLTYVAFKTNKSLCRSGVHSWTTEKAWSPDLVRVRGTMKFWLLAERRRCHAGSLLARRNGFSQVQGPVIAVNHEHQDCATLY